MKYPIKSSIRCWTPLNSLPREEKIALLHRVDKVARAADARVREVNASLSGVYEQVLVAASDGTLDGGRASAGAVIHQRTGGTGTVSASVVPAAAAAVLVTTISWPTKAAKCVRIMGAGSGTPRVG